jgi:hypothetical protein
VLIFEFFAVQATGWKLEPLHFTFLKLEPHHFTFLEPDPEQHQKGFCRGARSSGRNDSALPSFFGLCGCVGQNLGICAF